MGDNYFLEEDYEYGQLVLSKIDIQNRQVQGWFEARYIIEQPNSGTNPDTVFFMDCHFSAKAPE
jgi:hypothetical protein